jgi:hypothetical protein
MVLGIAYMFLTDISGFFVTRRPQALILACHVMCYISGKMCWTEISTFFLLLSITILEHLAPFFQKIFFFWYMKVLSPKFWRKKNHRIEGLHPLYHLLSLNCKVVDVIELAIECGFCLHKGAGSWCPLSYYIVTKYKNNGK